MIYSHLSLFSGIGGLDLAAEWADYPTKVLEKHWPDVPRWRDIRTLTKESFYAQTGLGTVDIISGGFPCQPFSVAGKQKGKGDDRYLWPEMLRVIRELTPRWVIGENVPGILRIAAADVIQDLEHEGYDVALFDFEAAAVGAPHRRERVFFVAVPFCGDQSGIDRREPAFRPEDGSTQDDNVRNADGSVWGEERKVCGRQNAESWGGSEGRGWSVEPGLGGVADGFPGWLDEPAGVPRVTTEKKDRANRLKCLGNAVVPQQAYPIFRAILEEIRRHE